MYEDTVNNFILRSKVSELQSGGGGLIRVCAKRVNGRTDCAFADSSLGLRMGDTVYMRFAMWFEWASHTERTDARFEGQYSVITEAEAKALVETGKLQIIE